MITVIGWKIRDFDKYFFKTAKRQAGETVSLQERPPDADTGTLEFGDSMDAGSTTPSQIVIEREGYQMLEKALKSLPLHFRKVICLRHLEQRSVKETAEILDMTTNAVNVLFHRAQQRLHELLKEMTYFSA